MPSSEISLLHPQMIPLVDAWKRSCPVPTLVYCTVRESWEQAVLYCQGRTDEQIANGVARLHGLGLVQQAMLLENRKAAAGKRVTNALPGLSFHQPHWLEGKMGALALDFVPMVGGKPQWADAELYEMAGAAAEAAGLTWSGRRTTFRETAHLQYDRGGELKILPLAQGAYR